MIFQNKTLLAVAILFVELISRPYARKSPTYDHHVIFFTGILSVSHHLPGIPVTDQVRRSPDRSHIAVGDRIVAHSAKTGPGIVKYTDSGLWLAA